MWNADLHDNAGLQYRRSHNEVRNGHEFQQFEYL